MSAKLTADALYREHADYVMGVLPTFGIRTDEGWTDAEDVAQEIWTTVHARLSTYDAVLHKSPRAWITGIVRRCAANHRRTLRRRCEVPEEEGQAVAARGLNPEETALLRTVRQAVRSEDRFEAFMLKYVHGNSIEEIAVIVEATEGAVEKRIHMAKKDLARAGEEQETDTAGAYLGFGSLEALVKALQPRPVPPELHARVWERVTENIGSATAEPVSGVTSQPPVAPPRVLVSLTKATLVCVVVGTFLNGVAAGTGGMLGWQAFVTKQPQPAAEPAAMVTSELRVPLPAPCAQSFSLPAAAAPAPPANPAPPSSAAPTSSARTSPVLPRSPNSSKRLLFQMHRAAQLGLWNQVLALAAEHERLFSDRDVEERESERSEALSHLAGRAQ